MTCPWGFNSATDGDLDEALVASAQGFLPWRATPPRERPAVRWVCEIPHMLLPVSVDMGSTTSHRVACESVTR
ncbi:hypothetical protein [Sphingomonas sp. Sph1(2015)]|uniref:hypothetical protein n=1 Tax=Sphingomonas sp. Sph1(2015) TaxID=1628084 RepID=UPI0011158FB9|nr:hypothetical protein [Sphingomonas sp. Sph1(2015)]